MAEASIEVMIFFPAEIVIHFIHNKMAFKQNYLKGR